MRPPKLGPQPSPWERSFVGNRKLIRFSWDLCQPSPFPEYKALDRHGISFTHLADKSREGEVALSPGWEPQRTEGGACSPLRPRDPEPRDPEHDASGVCNKCLLNELMSPSALLGNLAQNREEHITLNFAVSKWKWKTGLAVSLVTWESPGTLCEMRGAVQATPSPPKPARSHPRWSDQGRRLWCYRPQSQAHSPPCPRPPQAVTQAGSRAQEASGQPCGRKLV